MKKITLLPIFIFLFFGSHVYAQINKGDLLLGGTAQYTKNTISPELKTNSTFISPRIGYAVGNNSVISADLGISFGKTSPGTAGVVTNSSGFNGGLSWKRYFNIKDRFGWFTNLYGNSISQKYRYQSPGQAESVQRTTGFAVGVKPAFYFMPSSRLLIIADIGGIRYEHDKVTENGQADNKYSSFNVNLLTSFSFGLDFIIPSKRK